MKLISFLRATLLALLMSIPFLQTCQAQQSILKRIESASEQQLQQLLGRYPAADSNADGILSRNEARAYTKRRMSATTSKPGNDRLKPAGGTRKPDFVDVVYGEHSRHRFDVWKAQGKSADSKRAQPMIVFIHGGGFRGGDKSSWRRKSELRNVLDAGYAAAAINYPFRKDQPIQAILKDAANAVQLLRSRATEYDFDPAIMIGWGGSAGAGTSFWLTVRDDLADPHHADPVLRQSSRLQAAILNSTQATYDLTKWDALIGPAEPEWRQSENELAEFYHFKTVQQLAEPLGQQVLRECDMLNWLSADDGPLWIANPVNRAAPKSRGQYLHHFRHAAAIAEVCNRRNVKCDLIDGKAIRPTAMEFIAAVQQQIGND